MTRQPMSGNVLISSAGRRIGLVNCFRGSMRDLDLRGMVYAIDAVPSSPAFHLADRAWCVPRCLSPEFPDRVLELAAAHGVALVVPTIDTELPTYSSQRARFLQAGVTIGISSPETIAICCDKVRTHEWLVRRGFPTVRQASSIEVLNQPSVWQFPVIAKPRGGSASSGVRRVSTPAELELLSRLRDGLIVQEIAVGTEYTVNVYVNRAGRCVCAVPHERLEVRSGEVSKGVTFRHSGMIDLSIAVAQALPGAWGPLNIQCFLAPDGDIRIIEINARFGGGYPLAHHAGACMSRWLLEETLGRPVPYRFDDWQDDLAMLRYDDAVYLHGEMIRQEKSDAALCRV